MEKYKKSYKNNKFKISAPIWNEEFELLDEYIRYSRLFWIDLKKAWGKDIESFNKYMHKSSRK